MAHVGTLERLIAFKADVDAPQPDGSTALHWAAYRGDMGAAAALRAAQSGDIVLLKLLDEHGADPSIPTDHKVTALMVASGIGWVRV
jgi:ankyrin repeat protein